MIPLYQRDFEEFKNDGVWLQRAMNRMYAKECNDDPLFVQIVEQKNALEPNADTAFYLGILKDKAGKSSEALSYYNQAVELESDNFEKSKILYKIATNFKKKGRYGQARTYFMKALRANPSMGRAHLAIAAMYAKSANNCGTDNFSKRAVYWLAAKEAAKAGRIDPTMKKNAAKSIANYEAKAPTKSEIFSSGRASQVIKVGLLDSTFGNGTFALMKFDSNILLKNSVPLAVVAMFFSCNNTLKEVQGLDVASYAPLSIAREYQHKIHRLRPLNSYLDKPKNGQLYKP